MATIQTIAVLSRQGDTPQSYSENPGYLEGPWGESADEAVKVYQEQTGEHVAVYWERGATLWVIPASAAAAEVECAYCGCTVEDPGQTPVPNKEDDAAWAALAKHHDKLCGWILTRAHTREE